MSWRPGRAVIVTAVALVVLVTLGVGYLLNAAPDDTELAGSPARSTPPSPSASASAGAGTQGAAGTPAPTTAPTPAPTAALTPAATPAATPGAHRPAARRPPPGPPVPRHGAPGPPAPPPGFPLRPVHTPVNLPRPHLDFVISSFNVLGASHTSATGKNPGRASGPVRAVWAAQLIRRHGADVVGFQELQGSQLRTLRRHTNMDFYPGFAFGDPENSIGWRRDRWSAVETHTVPIPYFNGGIRKMPFVKLRSVSTGLEAWFANFHNPAETAQYHRQQRYRTEATRIESALANELINQTGLPVFVTGDMNERASYFCRFTAAAPMIAARGGSNNGRCLAGRPRAVDWIFGSQGVDFVGYVEDRSRLVDITTDHPVISARVHIEGKPPGD